ncbi:MAG: hypothetical protein Q7S09_03035 [bacterium]|nr:hypothetical protein [bacterium]
MENSRTEAQFFEAQKTLESSRTEMLEFLEHGNLDDRDRLRLTRVLQLTDRYAPEHREKEETALERWKSYLETTLRSIPPFRRRRESIPQYGVSSRSYLLAEKAVATLRQLRHIDRVVEHAPEFADDEILNQKRPEKIEREETLDTSLTLDYEKKHWGVERVCLDGVQNHLPTDSKGERVWVQCQIDGEWVSLVEARAEPEKIEAVRFVDDGVGFDAKSLALLYSTKSGEQESRGQFGEGMKMVAAAALREGLNLEYESQNWLAKPMAKPVTFHDTRHQKQQPVEQLSFGVQYLDGKPMVGSRTTFRHPTKPFVREVLGMEKKVLALRENYRPAFIGTTGQIVDTEPGGFFVKGIQVTTEDSLLSYNFDDAETNRDRDAIITDNLDRKIATVLSELSRKNIIKTLLKKSQLNPNALECSLYHLKPQYPEAWKTAFHEAFGEDAVIETDYEIPEIFKNKPLKRINFPYALKNALLVAGVKSDKESTPDSYEEILPTSLTLEYGKELWNEERMLLDAAQNHLPRDSGGTMFGLRFKTRDNKWHSHDEFKDYASDQIAALKIYDDGRGYDYRWLGVLQSTKGGSESAGKFGEGLKMVSAAALRSGNEMVLRSQQWVAKPEVQQQEIGDKRVDRVVYRITHGVKGKLPDDDTEQRYQSSSTTFENPTQKLVQEFRNIDTKILSFERLQPVQRTSVGDILSLDGGMLYVKQILIPGQHSLLFSYHFPNLEIKNRDRRQVAKDELEPLIGNALSELSAPDAIRQFLFKANSAGQNWSGAEKLEFETKFWPKDGETWKRVFQEMFGKNTAIRDVRSQDFDAMHENQHVGLELVTFPSAVCSALETVGLPTYMDRLREMTDVEHIPNEELSTEEKELLETLTAIDVYLPNNRPSEIRVYKAKKAGQVVAAGFSDGFSIHLHRSTLAAGMEHAADVYIHEKAHHNTGGAADASAPFRNYATLTAANLALKQLRDARPDLFSMPSDKSLEAVAA